MWIDLIFIIVLALGFYIGYSNGLLGTILKLVLMIFAFLLALRLFPIMFLFLENTFVQVKVWYFILGFILVLGLVLFLYKFTSNRIEKWISTHRNYIVTKLIGGLVLGVFILMVSSFVVGRSMRLHLLKPQEFDHSLVFPVIVEMDKQFGKLLSKVDETINKAFEENVKSINKIGDKNPIDTSATPE